jgi:hypothetical protein
MTERDALNQTKREIGAKGTEDDTLQFRFGSWSCRYDRVFGVNGCIDR